MISIAVDRVKLDYDIETWETVKRLGDDAIERDRAENRSPNDLPLVEGVVMP
jgi:hypothetical protein